MRMSSFPSRLAIAGVLVAVLGVGACGTADSSGGTQQLSDGDVTLRLTWWGADARHERTQQAIEAFQEQYPNIEVIGEFSDWTGYWDKLATATAGGNAPDVIQMDQLYLASYADRGVLADLSQQPQLDTATLPPAVLDTGRSRGTLYGMPISTSAWGILVNQDKLAELGVALPDTENWTWDEFADFGRSVTEASGGQVHGFTPHWNEFSLQIHARQHGEALFSDGKVSISVPTLARYFQQVNDWATAGASVPASQFAEGASAALDQTDFATGKVAMIFANVTQLAAYTKATGGADLIAVKLPTEDGNSTPFSYLKPGMYWSVSAESEHPAEAELLINFLVNTTEAGEIIGSERGIPANATVLESIRDSLTPGELQAVEYAESIQDVLGDAPEIVPNGASEIERTIVRYLQDVMFDIRTAEEAAGAFVAELQSSIDAAQ
ncbi:ABC transporter substrate-binding protein [Micromonospora sp. LOL_023]|uniref:ABC transporter substrate-binding protein n=1 Tax=Micromonospora sp. LOL_023 TaxID=3345418 RepID=UPI003A888BDB